MTTSQQRMEVRDRRAKRLGAAVVVACGFLVATCDHSTGPEVPTPAAVEATQGANAAVEVATDLSLAARVKDAKGGAVSGVAVQWSIASGGGTLSAASTMTDDAGTARVTWTVGTTVGAGEVRASVSGVSSSASFPVTLTPGPAATVALSADTARFTALEDTARFTATVYDDYGNVVPGVSITWSTTDAGVVTVDGSGLVTALANGSAGVAATTGSLADTAVVVVQQAAASVTLAPTAVALTAADDTVRLGASATDANGHAMSGAVTWTSTSPAVATVTAGLVSAVSDGTTQIVATVDGAADSVAVPVTTGAGVSRTWNGGGSADWVAPLSWTPAGRPNAMDTAMVASGTPASPVLNGDAPVGRVEVAGGATLDLGTHTLTVAADALAAGAITATTGKLHISNDGQIQGTLPLLEVNGLVDATAATTLIGGLRVLGGTLRTQGQRVTIQGG